MVGSIVPPARHQRRILIAATALTGGDTAAISVEACLTLQERYIGGLFISIPETSRDEDAASLVGALLRLGLSPHLVTFFPSGCVAQTPEWDDLVGRPLPSSAVEIVAVGATDVAGYPASAVAGAADVARAVNHRLGRVEFAVPQPFEAHDPWTRHSPDTDRRSTFPAERASALLAEGARKVRREYEQRLDVLEELIEGCTR